MSCNCNNCNCNHEVYENADDFIKRYTYQFDLNSGKHILINTNNTLQHNVGENAVGIDVNNNVLFVDIFSLNPNYDLAKETVINYINNLTNSLNAFAQKLN